MKEEESEESVVPDVDSRPSDNDAFEKGLSLGGVAFIFCILLLALGFLRIASYAPLGDFSTLGLVLVISWFIYSYLDGKRRIWRHAILTHVAFENSWLIDKFWESCLSKALHALFSVASAVGIIVIANLLRSDDWWFFLLSIFTFSFILLYFDRKLSREIVNRYRVVTSISFAYWVNILFLLVVYAIYGLFFMDLTDTRSLSFSEVIDSSFIQGAGYTDSEIMGVLFGFDSVLREGSLHMMQMMTSTGDVADHFKLIAWLAFFAFTALQYGFLWLFLIGVLVFSLRIKSQGWGFFSGSSFSRSAVVAVGSVFIVGVVSYQAGQWYQDRRKIADEGVMNKSGDFQGESERDTASPQCIPDYIRSELAALDRRASKKRVQLRSAFEKDLGIFLSEERSRWEHRVEVGVDNYLDWNFSVKGQYISLFYWLAQNIPGDPLENERLSLLADRLEVGDNIHGSLDEVVRDKLDEHVVRDLYAGMPHLGKNIEDMAGSFIGLTNNSVEEVLHLGAVVDPSCMLDQPPEVDFSGYFQKRYTGLGAIPAATPLAARYYPNKSLSRVMSTTLSRAEKRVSAGFVRRMGAKFSARVAGHAAKLPAGVSCGFAAPVCALGALVAGEAAIIMLDEKLHRKEMKEEMMGDFERVLDELFSGIEDKVMRDMEEAMAVQKEYQDKTLKAYEFVYGL